MIALKLCLMGLGAIVKLADNILDIAKRRGFFWQNSTIHGAMAGFYDYGHLGTRLKRNWENVWRKYFLSLDDSFHEIQTAYIMPENVFKASGHLASFVDPIVKCKKCGNTERADHLLEDVINQNFEGVSLEKMAGLIKEHNIRCPKCKGRLEEIGLLNMMFPLEIGTGKEARTGYLTPETAQGAYVNFKAEFECLRKRLPMGLAIIGKAYRNEIAPRNALIRQREFTQAELQIFFDPDDIGKHPRFSEVRSYKLRLFPVKKKKIVELSCSDAVSRLKLPKFYVYHMARIQQFYLNVIGINKKLLRFRELDDDEKAFYNKYHWDIEIDLESLGGFREMAGIHYRTDHDLLGHQKVSGKSMEIDYNGKKVLPHVLELSFGVDRNIYALLELAMVKEKDRVVLRFPGNLSPYQIAIFPLVRKDGLPEKARSVFRSLRDGGFNALYDEAGSIGRLYYRHDESGTPAAITIDYDTLKDDSITLRDRDSQKQIRVKMTELVPVLKRFLAGERIENLGKLIRK